MDPYKIIDKFYPKGPLHHVLVTHSEMVRDKALECIRRRGLEVDSDFVASAALLHDIGIIRCDAPGIECHGTEPYIRHGIIGAEMLRALAREEGIDLEPFARVCERHTGAGLTREDIIAQNLPLPLCDYLPETAEERLICYADKFYSKSGDLKREKSLDKVIESMRRHGADTLARFMRLHGEFGFINTT